VAKSEVTLKWIKYSLAQKSVKINEDSAIPIVNVTLLQEIITDYKYMNMTRTLLLTLYTTTIIGCTSGRDKTVNIFIPMNYTGWVNIVFNDSSSVQKPLEFDNGCVYLITGNPGNYRVKTDIFDKGPFEMNFFYYNTDTVFKLSWLGYPKKNIFFERTIGNRYNKNFAPSILAYSFYVSKDLLIDSNMSVENVPENKLLH